jgi:hypothetical protein
MIKRLSTPIVALAGQECGQNPALSSLLPVFDQADLPRIMPGVV